MHCILHFSFWLAGLFIYVFFMLQFAPKENIWGWLKQFSYLPNTRGIKQFWGQYSANVRLVVM